MDKLWLSSVEFLSMSERGEGGFLWRRKKDYHDKLPEIENSIHAQGGFRKRRVGECTFQGVEPHADFINYDLDGFRNWDIVLQPYQNSLAVSPKVSSLLKNKGTLKGNRTVRESLFPLERRLSLDPIPRVPTATIHETT